MVRRINGRSAWLSLLAASSPRWRSPLPAAAQSTGMVKGVVNDDKGKPVEARRSPSR